MISAQCKKIRLLEEQCEIFHEVPSEFDSEIVHDTQDNSEKDVILSLLTQLKKTAELVVCFSDEKYCALKETESLKVEIKSLQTENQDLKSRESELNNLEKITSLEKMIEMAEKEYESNVSKISITSSTFETKNLELVKEMGDKVKRFDDEKRCFNVCLIIDLLVDDYVILYGLLVGNSGLGRAGWDLWRDFEGWTSKGYRAYNKRTCLIVESIHIKFDEIKEMMSDHNSSDLAPQRQEMYVENVSSDLVPQGKKASDYENSDPVPPRQNVVPSVEKTDSSHQELEFLFSPLIEEYYTPANGHAEDNNNDQAPNASFQEDEFINPFFTRVQETDGNPVTCCGCEGPLNGRFCSFCASRAGNSFAYDPNPNSFDDYQDLSDYPPQP
ncbi:hypothetical protein Tco_0311401 [Tanacetum coccineum]